MTDLTTEKEVTPELVREVMGKVSQLRANLAEKDKTLKELVHTLVVKVGEERVFSCQERYGRKSAPICERCGEPIGWTVGERAVSFDGKWWHKHNCGKETT